MIMQILSVQYCLIVAKDKDKDPTLSVNCLSAKDK